MEVSSESAEACLYTRDVAKKKQKRWVDGFLVRLPDSTLALFDMEWTTKIGAAAESVVAKARERGNGATFVVGNGEVLVQLAVEEDETLGHDAPRPRPTFALPWRNDEPTPKKPKEPREGLSSERYSFRAPKQQSLTTWHDVDRLLGVAAPRIDSLPHLAVLSTARRTPEEPAPGGDFVNLWEAAVGYSSWAILVDTSRRP